MTFGAGSAADTSLVARYEALIRVSQALGACHEREVLFRSLADELRHVIAFDFLGLGIYNEPTHSIDLYMLASTGELVPPPALSTDESMTYWVVRHQEPIVMPTFDGETRFPRATAYMQSQGMRSTCSLPLTTPRRRIGLICFASREPRKYEPRDLTFMALVANQVALAIDDALNYDALQHALVAA